MYFNRIRSNQSTCLFLWYHLYYEVINLVIDERMSMSQNYRFHFSSHTNAKIGNKLILCGLCLYTALAGIDNLLMHAVLSCKIIPYVDSKKLQYYIEKLENVAWIKLPNFLIANIISSLQGAIISNSKVMKVHEWIKLIIITGTSCHL